MGKLVIMALGFGLEGPASISDTTKDPPSARGVHARKICGPESHVVGC